MLLLRRLLDLFRRRRPPEEEDDEAFVRSLFTGDLPTQARAPSYLVEEEPEAPEDRPYLDLAPGELKRHATQEVEITASRGRPRPGLAERVVIEPMRMVVDNARIIVGTLVIMMVLAIATMALSALAVAYLGPLVD